MIANLTRFSLRKSQAAAQRLRKWKRIIFTLSHILEKCNHNHAQLCAGLRTVDVKMFTGVCEHDGCSGRTVEVLVVGEVGSAAPRSHQQGIAAASA